ncbi:condensation domain-containing protein [Acrocarpospora sp. B8E8]|uniref:condensation domain-containing protein n=1 Tax=Acrocarpospora sp. B8E8 TaxID=3153572 RepID=UPI00325F7AF1
MPVDPEPPLRSGPLTWGQRWPWLDHYNRPEHREFNDFPLRQPIPAGLDTGQVLAALRALVARHEVLRTAFVIGEEGDPVQVVCPVEALEPVILPVTAPGGEANRRAFRFFTEARRAVDLTHLPVAAAVVTVGGVPHELLLALDHIAVDRWAFGLLCRDLTELLEAAAAGRASVLDPAKVQPLDAAAIESGEAGERRKRRALEFWDRQLREMPQTLFPEADPLVGAHRAARAAHAELRSGAVTLAAALLARRRQVSPVSVLLTASIAALSATTGFTTIPIEIQSANRFRPHQAGLVSSEVLPAMAMVRVHPGDTMRSLTQTVAAEMVRGLRYGHCDHMHRMASFMRIAHERGVCFYALPEYNHFAGQDEQQPHPVEPGLADLEKAAAESKVTTEEIDWWDRFRIQVEADGPRTRVSVFASRRIWTTAQAAAFLELLEELLVSFARAELREPAEDAFPFRAIHPPALWIDGCRIDLAEIRRMLLGCAGVRDCMVVLDGDGVLAYVAAGSPQPVPQLLHREVVRRLPGHPAAIAPRRYVIVAAPPTDPASTAAWAALPVVAEDDGRGPVPDPLPDEGPLLSAVLRHAAPAATPEESYTIAGGEPIRIPAVLTALRREGYQGLDMRDLMTNIPLGELAARLKPVPCDVPRRVRPIQSR